MSKIVVTFSDTCYLYSAISDYTNSSDIALFHICDEYALQGILDRHDKIDLLILDKQLHDGHIALIFSRNIIDTTNTAYKYKAFNIQKPFRLQLFLQIFHDKSISENILCFIEGKNILYNQAASMLYMNQTEIALSNKENEAMYIIISSGGVISKESIIERLWGAKAIVTMDAVDAFLGRLRKKIPNLLIIDRVTISLPMITLV